MNNNIEKLLQDREHGATWIQEQLINALLTESAHLSLWEIKDISLKIKENYSAMVQLQHLSFALSSLDGDIKNGLEEIKKRFENFHNDSLESCVEFLLNNKPNRIVTISYSSQVLNTLISYRKRGGNFTVLIGEGNPAKEGIIAANYLRKNRIRTYICKDEHLAKLARKKDIILIGSDAIGQEWLINKVGSYELVIVGAMSGVPTILCGTKDKVVHPEIMGYKFDTDFLIEFKDEITKMHLEIVPTSIIWEKII